jgi:hypothetical protein
VAGEVEEAKDPTEAKVYNDMRHVNF